MKPLVAPILLLLAAVANLNVVLSFSPQPKLIRQHHHGAQQQRTTIAPSTFLQYSMNKHELNNFGDWVNRGRTTNNTVSEEETFDLSKALQERQEQIQRGIGRRYVVIAPTLNVQSTISYPPPATLTTDNKFVVRTLERGDIFISNDKLGKYWIKHDEGGWSYVWQREGGMAVELIQE